MKTSLKQELLQHVIDTIQDRRLDNFDDLHYQAFNEDYYIIGYYQAEQWLKEHDISAFEAIADIIEYEKDNFGEVNLESSDINAESIVNLYVYLKGEELLNNFDLEQSTEDLLNDLKSGVQYG